MDRQLPLRDYRSPLNILARGYSRWLATGCCGTLVHSLPLIAQILPLSSILGFGRLPLDNQSVTARLLAAPSSSAHEGRRSSQTCRFFATQQLKTLVRHLLVFVGGQRCGFEVRQPMVFDLIRYQRKLYSGGVLDAHGTSPRGAGGTCMYVVPSFQNAF